MRPPESSTAHQAAVAVVLIACTNPPPAEILVRPVIDTPYQDSAADGFAASDRIELRVSRKGGDTLLSKKFQKGDPITLEGLPYGDDLVLELIGELVTEDEATPVAYGRTCPFRVDDEQQQQPHLFFSRTRDHAQIELVAIPRDGGSGLTVPDGALFVGGTASGAPVLTIEHFDALSGALRASWVMSPRRGTVHATFGANVAIVGGETTEMTGANYIELIRLQPAQIEPKPTDRLRRLGLTATTLSDGSVVAIGGHVPGEAPVGTLTVISRDPMEPTTPNIEDKGDVLAHPRSGHTTTRLGNGIGAPALVVGGLDAAGQPVAAAELYKPVAGELASPATFTHQLIVPRTRHHAVLLKDDSVVIFGGVDAAGDPVRTYERFSLAEGFVQDGTLPIDAGALDVSVTILEDRRVLVTGGRMTEGAPPTKSAYILDLTQGGRASFNPTSELTTARAGHQAALLCDGTVLISGGTGTSEQAERYNPTSADRQ